MPTAVQDAALLLLLAEDELLAAGTDLVNLTEAYLEAIAQLAEAAGAMAREAFLELAHINRADIAEFIDTVSPVLAAARAEAIDVATAYLAELTGSQPGAIDLREFAPAFDQPFLRTWHDLAQGQSWDDARIGGASQAEALGTDTVQQGAAGRMERPGIKVRGYRRVLSLGACEWCQVVSTQLYKSAESARFGHHDCRCTVVAVPFGDDPAHAINKERLAALKKSGAIQRATDARTRSRQHS